MSVGKTPYIRFDLNDYSVPHTQVRRTVTVLASPTQVRVLDAGAVIAEHRRVYGKGEQIEDPGHIEALIDAKRGARQHRGQDRLAHAAPSSRQLLREAAERGNRLSEVVSQLTRLLDEYGASALEHAIAEALANGVPHPNAVRQALERAREQRHLPPPLAIVLPDNAKARNIVVRPASLAAYDQLDTTTPPTWQSNRSAPMTRTADAGILQEALKQRALALKLHGLVAHWEELSDPQIDWVRALLQWEDSERKRRGLERRLSAAHIGRFKPLADFDWDWPAQCDKAAVSELMRLDFIKDATNVILVGPNGVGKSTIAQNIVHHAVLQGHSALFVNSAQMLGDLAAQEGDNALRRRLKHYAHPQVLVIDEVGY